MFRWFDPYDYDDLSRLTAISQGSTRLDTFISDTNGLLLRRNEGASGASRVTYGWDAIGRLTSQADVFSTAGSNVAWTFGHYNAASQITQETRDNDAFASLAPANGTTSYAVNGLNQYSSVAGTAYSYDAKGNVTNYSYDTIHGGVTAITRPAPVTGAVRPETRYTYSQVTSATGDLVYMPVKVAACQTLASCTGGADETQVTAAYNSNLLPTSITRKNGTGSPALTATTAFAYDARGNAITVDGPLSGTADTWAYKYDADDRLVGAISPDADGVTPFSYRALRLTYRDDGQVRNREIGTTTTQDSLDNMAVLQHSDILYDSNSRPNVVRMFGDTTKWTQTQFSYDSLGRLDCTAVRMDRAQFIADQAWSACVLGANTDPRDRITQNAYDAASHVTQVNVAVGTADAATERKMMYTDNGLVQTLTDGENNRTTFVYDAFDRLSKTRYPVPAKGANESSTTDYEQFTYDANSNVTADRARSGDTITYGYDNLDRVTYKGGAVAGVDYTYDNLGRMLTAKFSAGGQGVTNTYDALSRLTSTSSDMGGTARTLTNAYDLAGQRTRLTWPDGFYVDYDYLLTGELSKVRENGATTGAGVLATFGYDGIGNRTSLTRGNGTSTSYGYDTLSRLTSLKLELSGTTNDLTKTFAYNPASQIIQQTTSNDAYAFTGLSNGTTTTTTNGLNELATVSGAATAHDANGNLTSEPSVSQTFAYDTENKMTSATVGGTAASLSYDPFGRLWRVVKGGTDLRFLYDPASGADQMVAHYDSSGALQYLYVFTGNPDEPLLQYNSAGTRTWYSADERGSIIADSSDSGSLAGILRYDEYGNPQSGNSGRFQYTGQMWLNETSSYFYRNRAYAQWLGRFPQTDPIGYAGGANLYAYVLNDPINWVDPLGLDKGINVPPCPEKGCPDVKDIEVIGSLLPPPNNSDILLPLISYSGPGDVSRHQDIVVSATLTSLTPPPCNPCNATLLWQLGGDIVITGRRASTPFYFNGTAWVLDPNYVKPWYSNYFDACFVLCPPLIAGAWVGPEFVTATGMRIAPFGNRTRNLAGQLPHYHRRIIGPNGETLPGQGIRWHRPWERFP